MPLAPGDVFAGYTVLRQLGGGGMGAVYLVRHPRLPRLDALEAAAAGTVDRPRLRRPFPARGRRGGPPVPPQHRVRPRPRRGRRPALADHAVRRRRRRRAGAGRVQGRPARPPGSAHRRRDRGRARLRPPQQPDPPGRQAGQHPPGGVRRRRRRTRAGLPDRLRHRQVPGRRHEAHPDRIDPGQLRLRVARADRGRPGGRAVRRLRARLRPLPAAHRLRPVPRQHRRLADARPPGAAAPAPDRPGPWLSPAIDDVVGRAMAKDPAERYPTCRALAEAAGRALAPTPEPSTVPLAGSADRVQTDRLVEARTAPSVHRPPQPVPPVQRPPAEPPPGGVAPVPGRRNRVRWALAAAVVAVATAAAVTLWLLDREQGKGSGSSGASGSSTASLPALPAAAALSENTLVAPRSKDGNTDLFLVDVGTGADRRPGHHRTPAGRRPAALPRPPHDRVRPADRCRHRRAAGRGDRRDG